MPCYIPQIGTMCVIKGKRGKDIVYIIYIFCLEEAIASDFCQNHRLGYPLSGDIVYCFCYYSPKCTYLGQNCEMQDMSMQNFKNAMCPGIIAAHENNTLQLYSFQIKLNCLISNILSKKNSQSDTP